MKLIHAGQPGLEEETPEPPLPWWVRQARRLAWWNRTWELGAHNDCDGAIDGTGIIINLETPGWLRRWLSRRIAPYQRGSARSDISDVLIASLYLPAPYFKDGPMAASALGHFDLSKADFSPRWTEDRLQGKRGRVLLDDIAEKQLPPEIP